MSAMNTLPSLSTFWKIKEKNFLLSCIFTFPTIHCVAVEFGFGVAEHFVSSGYSSEIFTSATDII